MLITKWSKREEFCNVVLYKSTAPKMTRSTSHSVRPARGEQDLGDVKELFAEYAAALEVDVYSMQGFGAELEGLPGKYTPPAGELFIARSADGLALGCVAIKPFSAEQRSCELKRLYVRSAARGMGLGRELMVVALAWAAASGYTQMLLDSLPTLKSAVALYGALGFQGVPPYWDNPAPNVLYFAKSL